jgi:hypothetical protein
MEHAEAALQQQPARLKKETQSKEGFATHMEAQTAVYFSEAVARSQGWDCESVTTTKDSLG